MLITHPHPEFFGLSYRLEEAERPALMIFPQGRSQRVLA